jgi:radical SAM protein with 4Fe4S-binding SPASM domain
MENENFFDTAASSSYNENMSLDSFENISPVNTGTEVDNTSISELTTITSSNVRISKVWTHFTKNVNFKTNKKAKCNYCSVVYTCSGSSTSNLTKHLYKNHAIKANLLENETNIESFFNAPEVNIIKYFKIYNLLTVTLYLVGI